MANRYAVKSGNWSDPTVWDGGTLPGADDVVRPNGFTVEVDQDITVTTLTNGASSPAVAGGIFAITAVTGTRTITATVLCGSAGGALTLSHNSGLVIINGESNGGTGSSTYGTLITGSGAFILNGNANGSGLSAHGIFVTTATEPNITINGTVRGGSSTGCGLYINLSTAINLIINGSVFGGSNGVGVSIASTSGTLTITGEVIAVMGSAVLITSAVTLLINGSVYAGNSTSAGVNLSHGGAVVNINGSVTASNEAPGASLLGPTNVRVKGPLYNAPNGRAAILTNFLVVPEGENFQWHCTDDSMYPLDGAPVVLSNFVSDSPPPADVREGTTYGIDGSLVGTAVLPSPSSVRAGVPVDTTVGSAVVSPADVWEHEIAPGVTATDRLLVTSTDASTAALMEGALNHDE